MCTSGITGPSSTQRFSKIPEPQHEGTTRVGKVIEFHSAHYLPQHPTCGSMHGHTYRLEVEVTGPVRDGMILDFFLLKAALEGAIRDIDHHCLNDILSYPSVENVCQFIWKKVSTWLPSGITLQRVKLWETSTCYAVKEQ